MKKLIALLITLVFVQASFGQTRARSGLSVGDHRVSGTNVVAFDSLTIVDGVAVLYYNGDTLGVAGSGDITTYIIDTTSLSNRIDLKVNISDTSAALDPLWTRIIALETAEVLVDTSHIYIRLNSASDSILTLYTAGYLTSVDLSDINTTGTADNTTYLRGDGAWSTISAGSSTITDLGGTAWRIFYSNGSGEVTELALGADGTYLRSNGATSTPTFATPSGSGDMLAATYDTDADNKADTSNVAERTVGVSLGAGSIALVGNYSVTLTSVDITSLVLPSSGTLATETKVAQMISDSLAALAAAAEYGVALADSGVYDGGYITPTGLDAAIAAVETGAVDSSLYVTVTRLTDSLNVIRTQISSLISTINSAGLLVTSINVASLSGATVIDTDGGSLDFEADVSPDTAVDTTLTWSYIAGTGTADFETEVGAPTLTALTNGTVTVRATANDGSGIYGEEVITISNQVVPDETAPTLASAELGTYNDSILLAVWSENLQQDSIPPTSAFALTEDGNTFGIEAVTINGDSLFIALDSIGAYGSTYLLSYTPDFPAVQDSSENNAVSFTGQAVTNNVTSESFGPEMITYGDFSNISVWDEDDDNDRITFGTGAAVYDNQESGVAFWQTDANMNGEIADQTDYRLIFTVSGASGSGLSIRFSDVDNGDFYTSITSYENGTHTVDFTTDLNYSFGGLRVTFYGQSAGAVDDISLRTR